MPDVVLLEGEDYPTPNVADGTDKVFAGRVRLLPDNKKALSLFISFDNLRRGAATNSVGIAAIIAEKP